VTAMALGVGLATVEPERGGGVVDGDRPDGEGGRVGLDEHEAGVKARCWRGDVRAWRGECGLGDGVVLGDELELNGITDCDIRERVRRVGQGLVRTDDDGVRRRGHSAGDESGGGNKSSSETHIDGLMGGE